MKRALLLVLLLALPTSSSARAAVPPKTSPAASSVKAPVPTKAPAALAPAKGPSARTAVAAAHGALNFNRDVMPLLEKYCISCHAPDKKKGDLDLTMFRGKDEAALLKHAHVFEDAGEALASEDMPPEEQPQPTGAERELLLSWIETLTSRAAATGKRDPGRVTIRRLNRAEYNNTVRDLFGVDLQPAQNFPSDDVGYGFDNIGDVLTMPPILVERYMTAAERIAERVIVAEPNPKRRQRTVQIEKLAPTPVGSTIRGGLLVLGQPGAVRTEHVFPVSAEYVFKVRLAGKPVGRQVPRVVLRVDDREVASLDLRAGAPRTWTVRTTVEPGRHPVELSFPPLINEEPGARVRPSVTLDAVTVDGPLGGGKARVLPASHLRVIPRPSSKGTFRDDARAFLHPLVTRAYRRPATTAEVERLARFVDQAVEAGETFERGMQLAVRAMLMSPKFLYRVELDDRPTGPGEEARAITDHALAARLSYFLWSSMPDEELLRLANEGLLRDPEVLEGQVQRMLADKRAKALVENFATQWLQIRQLLTMRPSRRHFPEFDDDLRRSMISETELFFDEVMRRDLSILTFIDADFTYLNERLARHYGIPGVEGKAFRRVALDGPERGGVLTHASVLTVTSNPTRTSPVKRGRWVLEQLLGTPPPPPPPGVPELVEKKEEKGPMAAASLRQLLEEHRKDPNCAVCHRKMDPLGFGLENFNAVGAWRTADGESPIDSSGVLPNGQTFVGPAELKAVLLSKEQAFRKSLVQKMLTYALGRGTEPYDRPSIDEISGYVVSNGNKFSSLVLGIVKSDPFQKRRVFEEARP